MLEISPHLKFEVAVLGADGWAGRKKAKKGCHCGSKVSSGDSNLFDALTDGNFTIIYLACQLTEPPN